MKTTRKLLAYLTTQTPHTLRTRRSEILAEVVWWPVTFYLIQCGVGTGQETYMAPSILLRLASSSFLIRNGFLPAEVWMQCSQEPSWYSRGTYLSGCVLGRHISKLQPCAPGFDHVRPLFSVLFHIRFFSRTKIPWTLKSCGFFCFCFLISRYRSLPALGWHLRDKIVILKAERMQRDKME